MKHFSVLQAERRDEVGRRQFHASFDGPRTDIDWVGMLSPAGRNLRGLDLNEMAGDTERYWFVAAVFRDPKDLAETIGEMRSSNFAGRTCVVANHAAQVAREAVAGIGGERIGVVAVDDDGAVNPDAIAGEPVGMRILLSAMDGNHAKHAGNAKRDDADHSPIYAQLHEDMRDGALVLLASVAGPDAQIAGARLLLNGKCECVLTHEITASARPTAE